MMNWQILGEEKEHGFQYIGCDTGQDVIFYLRATSKQAKISSQPVILRNHKIENNNVVPRSGEEEPWVEIDITEEEKNND